MGKVFIHHSSDVQSINIGGGTRIWQFCVILKGARVGAGCNICAHVLIENDVEVGNDVTVKSGVQLWDGLRISDRVFIGPNVTFCNDRFPRSKLYQQEGLKTYICTGASIGANATLLPGITIGAHAMIGAGSVVTRSVPPNAIVAGNPATIVGYVGASRLSNSEKESHRTGTHDQEFGALGVGGCVLHKLPLVRDLRGDLSVAEYEKHIPFIPKRCFWVFNVPSREVRGEHAHKKLHQYLICVKGSVSVLVDDAINRKEVLLDEPHLGLYIPPVVWGVQYKYSNDAVLVVFASDGYDSNDYIRDYGEFVATVNGVKS